MSPDAWVPLAEIARPHGVRGELRLKLFNADSDVLLDQDEVLIRLKDGVEHEVSVDKSRRSDAAILMKLHSIDDRDRADEVRGALVCVRRRDFPKLDDGEFYACDVIGLRAFIAGGADLGVVSELRSYPSVEVLVVKAADGGRDWEVPLVEQFVTRVDIGAGEVEISAVEGLER